MASWVKRQFLAIPILLAVVFGACSEEKEIPADILTPDQMTNIMIKIHMLESKVGRLSLGRDSSKVLYEHYESLLLEKEDIDTALFRKSLKYYTGEPKAFKKVYEAVVDSLMELQSQHELIDQKREEEERQAGLREERTKRDSIRRPEGSQEMQVKLDSVSKKNNSFEVERRY